MIIKSGQSDIAPLYFSALAPPSSFLYSSLLASDKPHNHVLASFAKEVYQVCAHFCTSHGVSAVSITKFICQDCN